MSAEPSSRMTNVGPSAAAPEVRYYWSPAARRRWAIVVLAVLLVGVPEAALVGCPDAWIVVAFVSAPFWSRWLLWRVVKTGVSETQCGLIWRATGELHLPPVQGQGRGAEVRRFEYIGTPLSGERVAVALVDGTWKDVWGARPTMRWRGGETDDFVATLIDRARQFGAPIDDA